VHSNAWPLLAALGTHPDRTSKVDHFAGLRRNPAAGVLVGRTRPLLVKPTRLGRIQRGYQHPSIMSAAVATAVAGVAAAAGLAATAAAEPAAQGAGSVAAGPAGAAQLANIEFDSSRFTLHSQGAEAVSATRNRPLHARAGNLQGAHAAPVVWGRNISLRAQRSMLAFLRAQNCMSAHISSPSGKAGLIAPC